MPTQSIVKRYPRKGSATRDRSASALAAATNEIVVFPSDLGWMAALVQKITQRGEVLQELTFGHGSPQTAIARLASYSAAIAQPASRKSPLIRLLQGFARGERVDLDSIRVELDHLAPFARRVVELCRRIPYGQTLTYGELAAQAGSPRAARAVGNVMRTNRCPLVVPCHRVVPSGSGLGGYSAPGGVRAKLRLLELEGNR